MRPPVWIPPLALDSPLTLSDFGVLRHSLFGALCRLGSPPPPTRSGSSRKGLARAVGDKPASTDSGAIRSRLVPNLSSHADLAGLSARRRRELTRIAKPRSRACGGVPASPEGNSPRPHDAFRTPCRDGSGSLSCRLGESAKADSGALRSGGVHVVKTRMPMTAFRRCVLGRHRLHD